MMGGQNHAWMDQCGGTSTGIDEADLRTRIRNGTIDNSVLCFLKFDLTFTKLDLAFTKLDLAFTKLNLAFTAYSGDDLQTAQERQKQTTYMTFHDSSSRSLREQLGPLQVALSNLAARSQWYVRT